MFKKSGTKIKLLAKILFWAESLIGILFGAFVMFGRLTVTINQQSFVFSGAKAILAGFVLILVFIACAYVSNLILHSYGEIVDKTKDSNYLLTRIAEHTKRINNDTDRMSSEPDFPSMPREHSDPGLGEGESISFTPNRRV